MSKSSKAGPAGAGLVSRRGVLAGSGALVVSFPLAEALAQDAPAAAPPPKPAPLPGSLRNTPQLDAWLRIDAQGAVTVFTGKAELGQGIRTAIGQIAAEQLAVPFARVSVVTADTGRTPNEGYTAGSLSLQLSGTALMHAAAQAREILIRQAASRLGVGAEALKVEDGFVVGSDGRKIGYGELVSAELFKVRAEPKSKLAAPAAYKVMGKDVARVDIPAKLTGGAAFLQDMRLPGMLHARVVRPPGYGARLERVEVSAVEKMPGVRKVVRDGNFLAVVAQREFEAVKAMERLAAASTWVERPTMPEQAGFAAWLKAQDKKVITVRDDKGNAPAPVKTLEAEFFRPYHMHGSIGPSCGVAKLEGGEMTVWSHAQGMYLLRQAVSDVLRMPLEKVRCIHVEGSGCYGHNGADDAGADAALIASHMPGTPIRVQWMRQDEHTWEPYGAGMATRARASLDAAGSIVAWDYDVWTDAHSNRPGGGGNTLAGQHSAAGLKLKPPGPGSQPSGMGDRNIIPLYKIPNLKLLYNFQPHLSLRVSALRGLGAYCNVFSIESFMDELAAAAGADPVAFRIKHLQDQRAIDVVKLAAEKFGWRAGAKPGGGRGQGIAFARYKNLAGYCAVAVELEVEHESGRVRLRRAVAAADSGNAVNPDGIKNQIEGGILQSASWTLHEAVMFDRTRILSRDWSSYPILRFPEAFESIDVHVINRPGAPFLGTGEASQGPTGAAIANAIANATGARIRALPLTPQRIKSAIGV